jgi:hypothetical protein
MHDRLPPDQCTIKLGMPQRLLKRSERQRRLPA